VLTTSQRYPVSLPRPGAHGGSRPEPEWVI